MHLALKATPLGGIHIQGSHVPRIFRNKYPRMTPRCEEFQADLFIAITTLTTAVPLLIWLGTPPGVIKTSQAVGLKNHQLGRTLRRHKGHLDQQLFSEPHRDLVKIQVLIK